jgi:translocon-associated protein subunit beta
LNVNLVDENFPEPDFAYVSGFRSVKWPKIASGSNVTHTAVVRPRITGQFTFTHATVQYLPNEKAEKPQVTFTNKNYIRKSFIQFN